MKYKLGFIGTGVMAGAIIKRIIGASESLNLDLSNIVAYDLDENKLNDFASLGISKGKSANDVLENAEITM